MRNQVRSIFRESSKKFGRTFGNEIRSVTQTPLSKKLAAAAKVRHEMTRINWDETLRVRVSTSRALFLYTRDGTATSENGRRKVPWISKFWCPGYYIEQAKFLFNQTVRNNQLKEFESQKKLIRVRDGKTATHCHE